MIGRSCLALLLLMLSACSPPLQGEALEGLLIPRPNQFVTTDGHVYSVQHGAEQPRCLRVDGSVDEDNLTIHRVIWDREALDCRFETQTYRGLLVTPFEGVYYYTGSATDPWYPVDVRGADPHFSAYRRADEFRFSNGYRACLEVEGVLSQEGRFNHVGSSAHQLTVLRVVRAWPEPDVPIDTSRRDPTAPPQMAPPEAIAACANG